MEDNPSSAGGRSLLRFPRSLAVFKEPTSQGRVGKRRGEEGEGTINRMEGESWMEGFGPPKNFGVAPLMYRSCDSHKINIT